MIELPRDVAVIGAGTMGAGIARVFADGGASVRLMARRETSLAAAQQRLGTGPVRLTTSLDEALRGADLVVETIVEDAEPKREVLARAEKLAGPDAILTTNTSSLPLSAPRGGPRPAGALCRPALPQPARAGRARGGRRCRAHRVPRSSTLSSTGWRSWKAPIVVRRDVPGFVVNRLQYALREAYALVDGGVCSFGDVDRAVSHGLGARWAAIGPFETMDLAGLDVHAAVAANLLPELANETEPSPSIERVLETGALGVKSGRGLRGEYSRPTPLPSAPGATGFSAASARFGKATRRAQRPMSSPCRSASASASG